MTAMTRNQMLRDILKRVKEVSVGIDALTSERRRLNENFSKIAMVPDRANKHEAFNILSLASDDIDIRHSAHLKELQGIVDSIDDLQATYGADPMLSDARDFYATHIL